MPDKTLDMARIAVETCFWPLYEIENGKKWILNYRPKEKLPITEWINIQGRFRHLLRAENKPIVEAIQRQVDEDWQALLEKCKAQ